MTLISVYQRGLAVGDDPMENSPWGKSGDSNHSVSRCISIPVNPRVELRVNVIVLDEASRTVVPDTSSLGETATIHGKERLLLMDKRFLPNTKRAAWDICIHEYEVDLVASQS